MKEFDLFGFQVEMDEAATKEWYDKADEWGCDCGDCRYFGSLAKKRELPLVVLEVLDQFGIAPEKATYVCEMLTEDYWILYQFSYRMVGNILKEREGKVLSGKLNDAPSVRLFHADFSSYRSYPSL